MDYVYKFRIYPTALQIEQINKSINCARFVYNYYLADRKRQYEETGKSPTRFQQDKDMTSLKKKLVWLKEAESSALQNSIKDLDKAFQNFYRRVRNGEIPGYPRFKKKKERHQSYRINNRNNIKLEEKAIQLPKMGFVKCRISKKVDGRILSVTVTRTQSEKFYISICCADVEIEKLPTTGKSIGIDVGIKSIATLSDGNKFQNGRFYAKSEKKLRHLHRQLSRKTKGSNRHEKMRVKVAKCYEHLCNQRKDAISKLSTEIVKGNDIICIENLATKNMVKNHKLSKSILDTSWTELKRQITYKSEWYGRRVVCVDRFFPSSQICSVCGTKWDGTKNLRIREWECPVCGKVHDRDVNAALNILNEGLRLVT